uniref:Dermacentor 9 kDa family member n=1 Tax=Rhipicephalus zambeziensis TaxID=60191 RepID=A0A224YBM4_9ACAR
MWTELIFGLLLTVPVTMQYYDHLCSSSCPSGENKGIFYNSTGEKMCNCVSGNACTLMRHYVCSHGKTSNCKNFPNKTCVCDCNTK